jgi:hypothetical protein
VSDLGEWPQTIFALAALLVALGTIYRYVLPALGALWRLLRGTEEFIADWRQTGGLGGLYEQLQQVKALSQSSHRELHPNGGSSLRDSMTRVEEQGQQTSQAVDRLEGYASTSREGIAELRQQVDAQGERITDHRQRQEQTIAALREYLEGERVDLVEAKRGLEAAVSELLMVEGRQEYLRADEESESP